MNEFQTADGRLDQPKLAMALLELEAGTLPPSRRDSLMALIEHSPAAQRAYLEYFETSSLLAVEASTVAEEVRLPMVGSRRLFMRSLTAAAAILILGVAIATLIRISQPAPPTLKLTAAAETRWQIDGGDQDVRSREARLRPGARVRVNSGVLEMRLENDAVMLVQGPADISLPTPDQPVVHSGWLWVDSGPSRQAFEVAAPGLRIRNLGTRFGVGAQPQAPPEVHLISGKLELVRTSTPDQTLGITAEGTGLALPEFEDPVAIELADDPFPQLADLLAAPATHATVVRSQNPAGYWTFDETEGFSLRNEVDAGPTGTLNLNAVTREPGAGTAEGYQGFAPRNRALALSRRVAGTGASLGAVPRHEGLLFEQSFDATGLLNGREPRRLIAGKPWKAAPQFHADGKVTGGPGSATLAFEPVDGVIYTLEASIQGLTGHGLVEDWIAIGFASGQSDEAGENHRFLGDAVVGRAWMLFRKSPEGPAHRCHLSGISDPQDWLDWSGGAGGDIELRVVLDTTEGRGAWAATWYARRPGDPGFRRVRERTRLPNEDIDSVGIALTGEDTRARIVRFSLSADGAPDPKLLNPRADGPLSIQSRTGSICCWFRRNPDTRGPVIIWSVGADPADDSLHLEVDADGTARFFMENGRYDILLKSESSLHSGRWHHLAATWTAYTADLYVDGVPVAGERRHGSSPGNTFSELRIGRPHPQQGDPGPVGSIDEVAIWDRRLSPVEIMQQHLSAVGSTGP